MPVLKGRVLKRHGSFQLLKMSAIDHFRKNAVRKKHLFDKFDWEKSELVSTGSLPEELVTLSEEMKELLETLNTCTGDQKMVIVMRYFQDLSIAETAEILRLDRRESEDNATSCHQIFTKEIECSSSRREGTE